LHGVCIRIVAANNNVGCSCCGIAAADATSSGADSKWPLTRGDLLSVIRPVYYKLTCFRRVPAAASVRRAYRPGPPVGWHGSRRVGVPRSCSCCPRRHVVCCRDRLNESACVSSPDRRVGCVEPERERSPEVKSSTVVYLGFFSRSAEIV